jgi:hypothetical protein
MKRVFINGNYYMCKIMSSDCTNVLNKVLAFLPQYHFHIIICYTKVPLWLIARKVTINNCYTLH